jgi:hypothetical protein
LFVSLGLTDLYVPPLGDTPVKPLHAFLPLSVPSNVTFDTPGHQYPSGHSTQVASLALKYLPASQLYLFPVAVHVYAVVAAELFVCGDVTL